MTVVLDLDRGRVVHVRDGRKAEALAGFGKRLRASHANIEAAATDMSPASIAAVREHWPAAALVFDRFHIMKLFNGQLSRLRRELRRAATGQLDKRAIKGTRWLLPTNAEDLDDDQHARLNRPLELHRPLATADRLKESLRELREQPGPPAAESFLRDGCMPRRTL